MRRKNWLLFAVFSLALLLGGFACGNSGGGQQAVNTPATDDDAGASFALTSTAFGSMGTIPKKYTCDQGQPKTGYSPPLAWSNPPAGTVAFALTVRDPDAPNGDCKHWGLINTPAEATSLAEGASPVGPLPEGSWQTLNYRDEVGYAGPCPPQGANAHRYNFMLIALNKKIDNPGGQVTLDSILPQIEQATIGSVTLTGLYGR
jgi:hypothetical protein